MENNPRTFVWANGLVQLGLFTLRFFSIHNSDGLVSYQCNYTYQNFVGLSLYLIHEVYVYRLVSVYLLFIWGN